MKYCGSEEWASVKDKTTRTDDDDDDAEEEEKKNLTFVIIVLFVFSYIKLFGKLVSVCVCECLL